jgi:hypothetical protein
MYEKGPFNIHLKVRRPATPLVERKKERKWGQFDIFNVMVKAKISFQSIRQYARFILKVTFSGRMETNTFGQTYNTKCRAKCIHSEIYGY